MILNQISQSPFMTLTLARCIKQLGNGDGVLLYGDGVYALLPGHDQYGAVSGLEKVFALEDDVVARNITPGTTNVKLVSYAQWVAQTLAFSHVQTWK